MLAGRHELKNIVNKSSQFFEFLRRILVFQYGFDKFNQHIHLRFSLQAAYGIRGQFVFNAGGLLWVKEDDCRDAGGQATDSVRVLKVSRKVALTLNLSL
ncbi:MAG: hypothetical protein PSV18_11570, partial [Methylobacter sp.]|nr:hypothetical protein [Candidatus Methylobacter titanis]